MRASYTPAWGEFATVETKDWITAAISFGSLAVAFLGMYFTHFGTKAVSEPRRVPRILSQIVSFISFALVAISASAGTYVYLAITGGLSNTVEIGRDSADIRKTLANNTIRLSGEILVTPCPLMSGSVCPQASLILENLSGSAFEAVLKDDDSAVSIGRCIYRQGSVTSSGLTLTNLRYIQPPKEPVWRFIPRGGKIDIKIIGTPCSNDLGLLTAKNADVLLTLFVKAGEKTFDLPLNASALPIRTVKSYQ
jgi:hypothetical protein